MIIYEVCFIDEGIESIALFKNRNDAAKYRAVVQHEYREELLIVKREVIE